MQTPPFLIEVPHPRYFLDDHCANCLAPDPDDIEQLFCSTWCTEVARSARYQRRVFRDGRIDDSDVQAAVRTQAAFLLLLGGYASLGRKISPDNRAQVKLRANYRCQQCGRPGTEIDHIEGRSPNLSNLQLLCSDCHKARTAENMVPAADDSADLLRQLWSTRVAPAEPQLLADDEHVWAGEWVRLQKERRARFLAAAVARAIDVRGMSRAQIVVALTE